MPFVPDNSPTPRSVTPLPANLPTGSFVPDDAQPLGNEPSIAARANVQPPPAGFFDSYIRPNLPSFFSAPATNASGQPEYLDDPNVTANARAGDKLAARTLLRANPVLAIPNAAFVVGEQGINAVSSKLGGPTKEVFNPLESGIDALGLGMDPDAGKPMQIADAVLPWLMPTGNQVARVQEAPGAFNKVMTAGRSLMGNMVDWAASDEAQKWAQEHDMGPLAQTLAGMVGGNVRQGVARVGATQVPKVVPAKPDAGATFDVNKQLLPPEGSTVSTVPPIRDVADPDSSVASILSGASALPFSGTGQTGAVKAQTGAIARTADAGLQVLDPGTTSVAKAGPGSLMREGSAVAQAARAKVLMEERRLMAESDRTEQPAVAAGARTDAFPIWYAAAQLADNKDAGQTVQNQAAKVRDTIGAAVGSDGKVAFTALKNERSAFKQFTDGLYQAATGDATVSNMLASALDPLKTAMTNGMGSAIDTVSPQLGADWRQNDAAWTTHAAIKHQLEDVSGTLNRNRTGFDPAPGGQAVAGLLDKAVSGGPSGLAPVRNIEAGLGDQTARSAVAETLAAKAQPKAARARQGFRPDIFGEGEESRVDPETWDYVEQKAGPEARQNIQNAAAAGAATSEPNRVGGFKKAIGSVASAVPYVGPFAAAFGPAGALSPLVSMFTSAAQDPDFVRAVAGRRVPLTSRDLALQMMTHAALGSSPDNVDPMEALRYGAGQAANAVHSGVSTGINSIPAILKYLSVPPQPAGQR